jgi:flagellar hook-length control protein FliK
MNMDANLIFASTTAPNALSLGATAPVSGVDASMSGTMSGQEFAGVMRDLMTPTDRQGIAAPGADNGLGLATSGLQTLNLGDQLSLITTSSPLPDAGSLAEFARSQGLGESAVKALFGDLLIGSPSTQVGTETTSSIGWATMTNPPTNASSLMSLASSSNSDLTLNRVPTAPVMGTLQNAEVQEVGLPPVGISLSEAFPKASTLTWLASHPSAMPVNLEAQKAAQSVWANAPHQSLNLTSPNSMANLNNLTVNPGAAGAPASLPGSAPVSASMSLLNLQQPAPQALLQSGLPINTASQLKPSTDTAQANENFDTPVPEMTVGSSVSVSDLNSLLLANQASGTLQNASSLVASSQTALPSVAPANLPNPAIQMGLVSAATPTPASQAPISVETPLMAAALLAQVATKTLDSVAPKSIIQPASESPVEMGPLDAMRMRMVPAWETMTRQLAKLNGSDTPTTWANLASAALKSDNGSASIPQASLNLGDTDIGIDLLADLNIALSSATFESSSSPVNASNTEPSRSTHSLIGPTSTNSPLAPSLEDRGAQIQQLADKLGQAMSERLQEQMEKGQWRLHLKLNPGHLGSIDVELDMRNGGLDALFKTDNALTRELITQGMSKLREGLAQSGMAVANVWVNSDSQRESGGNSTPRQNNFNEANVRVETPETPNAALAHKELRSADGWDTLA